MILLLLLSLAAIAWRLKRRTFTRAEGVLLSIVLINIVLVWAQSFICDHRLSPERRYYAQSLLLVFPWGLWGLATAWKNSRLARWAFATTIGLFVVYNGIMLAKAHLPFGRRSAYFAACNWAQRQIAADWRGPSRDEAVEFSWRDYHLPYRPIVQAHSSRLPYLLGGRDMIPGTFQFDDHPDYWFSDISRDPPPTEGFALMGTFRQGKYTFELYKRQIGK